MNVRFSHSWYTGALGKALRRITDYNMLIPRVGGLCPYMSTPMPSGPPTDFAQCCDERAAELVGKYQTLYVMWSGGIDSTMVALYLAKHKKPTTKLILSTSEQSLTDASTKVLNSLKSAGFAVEPLSRERMIEVTDTGGMVITGHHADSILLGDFVDSTGIYEEIWEMTPVELFMKHAGVSRALAESALADMEPLLALMPAGMERTAANVGWWIDFCTYWDHDEVEFMLRLGLKPPGVGYLTFFNTEGFQLWAQQDVRSKAGQTRDTHKQVYLELIWEMLGYQESFVFKNRMVVPFDDPSMMPGPNLLKIREDYSVVRA
uniref:tRNA-specific 2-thiouridylase MnmA n=1 Tax=Pseudomonas phage Cygsa01 TaxID=3138529 RepID=A0AAU6W4I1_9VIRU